MPQLIQQLYGSILYGDNLESSANFQTFSNTLIERDGIKYYFLDADLTDTNRRQTQFTSVAQKLLIRSNPESAQNGIEIPGLSIDYIDFSLLRIIQLIRDTKGLRDAILKTKASYALYEATNRVREREGVYQISGCEIVKGQVVLTLRPGITPKAPMMPDIRRVS